MDLHELFNISYEGICAVTSVETDSRRCTPGSLFFAMSGRTTSGERFVEQALAQGAVAVVATTPMTLSVPVVVVDEKLLHSELVRACGRVYGIPHETLRLLGVTGTNAKTSITTIASQLWRALGHPSDVIGTVTHERTTPAPAEMHQLLAASSRSSLPEDPTLMCLEVSSHALDQGRTDGIFFDVVVFSNLTHDHLDYHHSMEEYFEAKSKLFTPTSARNFVVWVDDPYGARLADRVGNSVVRVSRANARNISCGSEGSDFEWRGYRVHSSLLGGYNVDNLLLALEALVILGGDPEALAHACATLRPVTGRFDIVQAANPMIVIDYAHSPDGLRRVLVDAREFSGSGRLIIVFGASGERDVEKRPGMGAVTGENADVVIVTSESPRFEDPESIIDDIVKGIPAGARWHREIDRRAAIELALRIAEPNDIVILAGKGHENVRYIQGEVVPFNDRTVVTELLQTRI